MKILTKKKSKHNITHYKLGFKKRNIIKSFFLNKEELNKNWIDLILCYFPLFREGNIELFLEIKHPLGSFNDFDNDFENLLKNHPVYFYNNKKFIVIKNASLNTLKEFVLNYYDQGLILLMSKKKLNQEITNELIEKTNLNLFTLENAVDKGFDLAMEFNFPSGREIYIVSRIEEKYIENCFKLS